MLAVDARTQNDSGCESASTARAVRSWSLWLVSSAVATGFVLATATGDKQSYPALAAATLALWAACVTACSIVRRGGSSPLRPSVETVLLGGLFGFCGTLAELHIAQHLAAAVVLVALCRRVSGAVLIATSVCWLPATDFVFGESAAFVRVVAAAGSVMAVGFRRRTVALPPLRLLGPIATALVLGGATLIAVRGSHQPSHLRDLPTDGLLFRSAPIALLPEETTHLADVLVQKRRYAMPAGTVDLLAIDGEANRHAVHDPTFCHRGAGWEVASRQTLPLPYGQATAIRYRRGDESTQCLFWFTTGAEQSPSAWWYWAKATMRRLSAGQSGPEPVLVVLQPVGEADVDWSRLLRECPALARF